MSDTSFAWRSFALFMAIICSIAVRADGQPPFAISGPGVDPAQFKITTFATGLNFPVGMTELDDGSIVVATSNGSYFGSKSGQLIRLADNNGDGVADQTDVLVSQVPFGQLTSVQRMGDLFFTTGLGQPIAIFRAGLQPSDPLTLAGSIEFTYPSDTWDHMNSALAVRATPGVSNSYDVFFQIGSETNAGLTTATVGLTSTLGLTGTLAGDAIHKVTVVENGATITAGGLQQIATGLRNPAGMAFQPGTGDLYFQDNGIDGLVNRNEPESADELNRIVAADLGGPVEDFGFPFNYVKYRTNEFVGGQGVPPLVAFQPIPMPDGKEGEGANDIAFGPALFPDSLRDGIFVGMHGKFNAGGDANEENPLLFTNLGTGDYFQFISGDEPLVGHLDGLLATRDSLFVADISRRGSMSQTNDGAIYRIQSLVPEPSSTILGLVGLGMAWGVCRVRSRKKGSSAESVGSF
ncbi:MAG: PEP-CTERM sorting domain-containing protein [Pirellulales bacterium]